MIDQFSRMRLEIRSSPDVVEHWAETIVEAKEQREPKSHVDAQEERPLRPSVPQPLRRLVPQPPQRPSSSFPLSIPPPLPLIRAA